MPCDGGVSLFCIFTEIRFNCGKTHKNSGWPLPPPLSNRSVLRAARICVDLLVKDAPSLLPVRAGMQIIFAAAILACVCGATALDNGLARTPPMGWRSWNAYGSNIHQDLMDNAADMMVDSSRGFSLKDRGYTRVGLDDYYQLCGAGAGGSFHNASGYPIIDQSLFPDMKSELFPLHSHLLFLYYPILLIC